MYQKYSLVSIEGLEVMTVNIWGHRCVYGDTECFGIVVPVFGAYYTVGRSTRQGDLITIQGSVPD